MMQERCPCHSGNSYEACCAAYHLGKKAENALILMRSRYSAYARGLADYLMATTHPGNKSFQPNQQKWREEIVQFAQSTSFDGLEILDFQEKGTLATVAFIAHLKQQGQEATFTERSQFQKEEGRWLYLSGDLYPGVCRSI
jgi:SEC-C motif domain protein